MQYLGGGIGHRESSAKAEIPNNVDAEGDNELEQKDFDMAEQSGRGTNWKSLVLWSAQCERLPLRCGCSKAHRWQDLHPIQLVIARIVE